MGKTDVDEVLRYAIENEIINYSDIEKKIAETKRKKYLQEHKWAISQGKDGYWRSYIPDIKKGRRMIKKKSKADLEDTVVEYYQQTEENLQEREKYVFKSRFDEWLNLKKRCERTDNTIYKYKTDYNRFFKGRAIECMDIRRIDEAVIMSAFKEVLMEKEIPYRALKSAFKYVDNVFEKSIRDKLIEQNPCRYVELQFLRKFCKPEVENSADKRTLSSNDRDKIIKKIKKSSNPVRFTIALALCTGMRVGELAALKWSDINFKENIVTIRSSEKYNRLTKEFVISTTKNEKVRIIPLTPEMRKIFDENKKAAIKNGCVGEFVFMNSKGRIHSRVISDWIRNATNTKEFEHHASIHGIRRTFNSIMRENGVSAETAAALLGHTKEVNNNHYTYSIRGMKEKEEILSATSKKILNNN